MKYYTYVCTHLECMLLNICHSKRCSERRTYIKLQHIFYAQYDFSVNLMVFMIIKKREADVPQFLPHVYISCVYYLTFPS
jgi:hypothetical protein